MTHATLTFQGRDPLTGTVETGGDYVQFRTATPVRMEELDGLRDGVVAIDGAREDVVLESAHPHRATPGLGEGPDGLELTLRRIRPLP